MNKPKYAYLGMQTFEQRVVELISFAMIFEETLSQLSQLHDLRVLARNDELR